VSLGAADIGYNPQTFIEEDSMQSWLSKHKFQAHLSAFLLMVISSIGMIFLMRDEGSPLTWLMILIFALANLLAVFIK